MLVTNMSSVVTIIKMHTGIIILVLVMVIYVGTTQMNKFTRLRKFPRNTIVNMIHQIIIRSKRIPYITDPTIAMIESRELQASLNTIVDMVGGMESLSTVCDLDIEDIRNNMQRQEYQLFMTYTN